MSTLENLVELSDSVLHTLSSHEEKPKFVQLCDQLSLTEKVSVSLICTNFRYVFTSIYITVYIKSNKVPILVFV